MPPSYKLPRDKNFHGVDIRCGTTAFALLPSVRPKVNSNNPARGVPENLFLRPRNLKNLVKDNEGYPLSGQVLFDASPLGVHTIGKLVPSWMEALGLDASGASGRVSNSALRHFLRSLLMENCIDKQVAMDAGGWYSEKGMSNYGSSTRHSLHEVSCPLPPRVFVCFGL